EDHMTSGRMSSPIPAHRRGGWRCREPASRWRQPPAVRALFRPRPRFEVPLALAYPAQGRLGYLLRRLVLAVAPRTARAFLMVALPARNADHAPYSAPGGPGLGPAGRRAHRPAFTPGGGPSGGRDRRGGGGGGGGASRGFGGDPGGGPGCPRPCL